MRQVPSRDFTLVDMARAFSVAAHTAVNQKRKYTGEDYHHHPEEVLQILLTYCDPSVELQAAALLHDIIEDTSTTRAHIARVFGQVVANHVVDVSDVSTPADGTRKVRKDLDRQHLNKASYASKLLKCADLISNSRSIAKHDPKFARTYLYEKMAILHDFSDELNGELIFEEVSKVCDQAIHAVFTKPEERWELYRTFNPAKFESFEEYKKLDDAYLGT